jgi:hypothetical protein
MMDRSEGILNSAKRQVTVGCLASSNLTERGTLHWFHHLP